MYATHEQFDKFDLLLVLVKVKTITTKYITELLPIPTAHNHLTYNTYERKILPF